MTLAYPLLNETIRFAENRVNVLVIENATELRRFLFCLKDQINGLAGELVLGENGDVIEMHKSAFLITDPFALDFDSKKLLTKITQDACFAGADFAEEFYSIMEQLNKLKAEGREYVLICGIEGHVCVLQSALDLIKNGFKPVFVTDCITSRRCSDYMAAVVRAEKEGVQFVTTEMALFELIGGKEHPHFKAISALVK